MENLLASVRRYFFGQSVECEVCAVFAMYYHNPLGFLIAFITWTIVSFFGAVAVIATLFPNTDLYNLELGIAVLLSAALNIRVRIVVCENGMEFHGMQQGLFSVFSKPVFSPWKDLSHFVVEEDDSGEGGVTYHRLLYLSGKYEDRPINIGKVLLLDFRKYKSGGWFNRREYHIVDPYSLTDSDFGKYLMRYAPHVIDKAKDDKQVVEALVEKDSRK